MTRNQATSTFRRMTRTSTKAQRGNRGPEVLMTTDGRTRTPEEMMSEVALRVATFNLYR